MDKVTVGSQYESRDKRDAGRTIEVLEIRGSTAVTRNTGTGKRVVISLARLLSKRWKCVADKSQQPAPPAAESKVSGGA